MPFCFDSAFPPHVAAHADGEWVERSASSSATPRYNLPASFWPTIGSKVHKDLPQHYGKCDDVRPSRGLYDWKPRHCDLLPFARDKVCAALAGKQIVVVGDSTVLQFFIAFVKLLDGEFGRDVKHGYVTADLTASACSDSTRIVFIRSDLLLWTHSVSDYHAVQRCDGFTILHPFVLRASRDADIVLLGVGHHFPRALMLAEKWTHWSGGEVAKRARVGFFTRNLNHTLVSLLSRRAAYGRRNPASVVLLGASTPVRGCARFTRPLRDPIEAMTVAAGAPSTLSSSNGNGDTENVSTNELRWMQYPRYNTIARTLAMGLGASFIDVAAPSALRPDGAMGGYWPKGDNKQRDCVHYCLPGVVDTWVTLLYNLIASPRMQAALQSTTSSSSSSKKALSRNFLTPNASEWLKVKGYSEKLEACTHGEKFRGGEKAKRSCETLLQLQPWWAFKCVEPRERKAVLGADFASRWAPWMPAESFD